MQRLLTCLVLCAIGISCSQPTSARQTPGLPSAIRQGLREPDSLPAGRYTFVTSWDAAGLRAQHQSGRGVKDVAASNGTAWQATVGADEPGKSVLYGPYIDEPPGDYVAFYRIELLDETGEDEALFLDTSADRGAAILATKSITAGDLTANKYVEVALPFHLEGKRVEVRALWPGYSNVRIDRIALYRLEGGTVKLSTRRAAQPVERGTPKDLMPVEEPRPFPEIFPRSEQPAPRLIVADIRRVPPDSQLMLLGLQGLVNRKKPEIYCIYTPTDEQWLANMLKRSWVKSVERLQDPMSLVSRFADRFKGAVMTDPALPASRNIATMVASVDDLLIVSPRLAKQTSVLIARDLRGKFQSNTEAYRWAFDNLWPRLNHHLLACSWPDHLGLRDYLVENRVFIFWISGPIDGAKPYADPDNELHLMEDLLGKMPVNIPVMSYPWASKDVGIGEGPGVTLFAEFGKYLVGSIDCTNLSVHSGFRIPVPKRAMAAAPMFDRSKVYVSWVISDGDNLPVLTNSNFPKLWADLTRGTIPLGWSITPSAANLIPDVVDYYYSTATPNDDFLAAVSGIGYTYPDAYGQRFTADERGRMFDGFLNQTADGMATMGLTDAWLMNISTPELFAHYAEQIPKLNGIFPDYGSRVSGYEDATYPTARSIGVFHAATNMADATPRDAQIAGLVRQIKALTPAQKPAFLHLFALNWYTDLPMLQEVLTKLGPEYAAVRPDQLSALYHDYLLLEKAIVRAPSRLAAIGDGPIRFTVHAQNVSPNPMTFSIRAMSGLMGAKLTPQLTRLKPGQEIEVVVEGKVSRPEIDLESRGSFGMRRTTIAVNRMADAELVGSMPRGPLEFVRVFNAAELSHRAGAGATEPSSHAPRVWKMTTGKDDPGFAAYGPYAPVPAGKYVALFRVRRTTVAHGPLLTVDASADGGNHLDAERVITAEQLPEKAFRAIPLVFDHPGGALETRVQWTGAADVELDTVTLWRVK